MPVSKCLKNCRAEPMDTFFVASESGTQTNGESSRRQISQQREEMVRPVKKRSVWSKSEPTKTEAEHLSGQTGRSFLARTLVHLAGFSASGKALDSGLN